MRPAIVVLLGAAGCVSTAPKMAGDGGGDDGSGGGETPGACSAVEDGQECGFGCPEGKVPVTSVNAPCRCYVPCNPQGATACACARKCTAIGSPTTGACLPAVGAAESCQDFECAADLSCVRTLASASAFPRCAYPCSTNADCPQQTECAIIGSTGKRACALTVADNGAPAYQPCDARQGGMGCAIGNVCAGDLCVPVCEGPGAKCQQGKCQKVIDSTKGKIIAWACQ